MAAFCLDFSNAWCDFEIRCGAASQTARADCLTFTQTAYCKTGVVASALKGYQTFKADAGAACINSLKTAGCAQTGFGSGCEDVFAGGSGTDAGCLSPNDCTNKSTESCRGSNCAMTCRPAGMTGQPCFQSGTCGGDLKCDAATGTCGPKGGLGASCYAFLNDCSSGTYCDASTLKCAALPTTGQMCRVDPPFCRDDLFCDFANTTCQPKGSKDSSCLTSSMCLGTLYCDGSSTCQPRLATAATCTDPDSCAVGLSCRMGKCGPLSTAGQACTDFADCAQPLICDPVLLTCNALTLAATSGKPCTGSTLGCVPGLICVGAASSADGGVGTLGACHAPTVGDSCATLFGSECPLATFCSLAADGGPGFCVPSVPGSPCQFSSGCPDTEYCNLGLCETRKASGAACSNGDACVNPLSCVEGPVGAFTCKKLGELSAPCVDDGTPACQFPYNCVGTTCQHAGAVGEACIGNSASSGGICISGTCLADGGCGAPQPAGAPCSPFRGGECQSGQCINGMCAAICL